MRPLVSLAALALFLSCARAVESADRVLVFSKTAGFRHDSIPDGIAAIRQFYDGGRAWYTALGHTREAYAEPLFREHLLGGIRFAAGFPDGDCPPVRSVPPRR